MVRRSHNRDMQSSPRMWAFLVLAIISTVSLVLCPHSKVEESFNLQATHDLFYIGVSPAFSSLWCNIDESESLPYDHTQFPGVVPRTFAGPFVIAYTLRFISIVMSPVFSLPSHPLIVQFLARFLLLGFNLHALYRLGTAAERKIGGVLGGRCPLLGMYFFLISASQFHLPFYCSRMLPNMFALGVVVHGYAAWFDGLPRAAAAWIVVATAVFRCDVLILLFTVGLSMLLRHEMTVMQAIATGAQYGVISLASTVPLDSLLWGRCLWPEGEVLLFNTVENKSSEWGTSPWHWYASSALPKALLLTALLVPFAFLRIPETLTLLELENEEKNGLRGQRWRKSLFDTQVFPYLTPAVAFVAIYSFLPHKEMRFVFPAVPMLNVAAAYGLERLHSAAFPFKEPKRENKARKGVSSLVSLLLFVGGVASICITLVGSSVFLSVSRHNYPGGEALTILRHHIDVAEHTTGKEQDVKVHVDVAAAMTGVSLFGQRAASRSQVGKKPWVFDKAGYEKENEMKSVERLKYTHLLSEKREQAGYQLVGISQGYPRFDIRHFQVATEDAIFIHEREGWK